jgi:hypothetical protein
MRNESTAVSNHKYNILRLFCVFLDALAVAADVGCAFQLFAMHVIASKSTAGTTSVVFQQRSAADRRWLVHQLKPLFVCLSSVCCSCLDAVCAGASLILCICHYHRVLGLWQAVAGWHAVAAGNCTQAA